MATSARFRLSLRAAGLLLVGLGAPATVTIAAMGVLYGVAALVHGSAADSDDLLVLFRRGWGATMTGSMLLGWSVSLAPSAAAVVLGLCLLGRDEGAATNRMLGGDRP